MNSHVYDILKWVAIIVLPALSTLISVVFQIWGIPYGTEIAQTITAIATFLGAILMVSSISYLNKSKKDLEETKAIFKEVDDLIPNEND